MFDIGFIELLLVGLVVLVVFGFECLLGVVCIVGLWIGWIKCSFNLIKVEIIVTGKQIGRAHV